MQVARWVSILMVWLPVVLAGQDKDNGNNKKNRTTSPRPTMSPFPTMSPTVSPKPSKSPTMLPTAKPTASPAPTKNPTIAPTSPPTVSPNPTAPPSSRPSPSPTGAPTISPTGTPSEVPTPAPTDIPSDVPSGTPSRGPTQYPSLGPSDRPTVSPTGPPSLAPSAPPTRSPSPTTSASPTMSPTTLAPTTSQVPSQLPTIETTPVSLPELIVEVSLTGRRRRKLQESTDALGTEVVDFVEFFLTTQFSDMLSLEATPQVQNTEDSSTVSVGLTDARMHFAVNNSTDIPSTADVHNVLSTYFGFWGGQDLSDALPDYQVDRIVIDGEAVQQNTEGNPSDAQDTDRGTIAASDETVIENPYVVAGIAAAGVAVLLGMFISIYRGRTPPEEVSRLDETDIAPPPPPPSLPQTPTRNAISSADSIASGEATPRKTEPAIVLDGTTKTSPSRSYPQPAYMRPYAAQAQSPDAESDSGSRYTSDGDIISVTESIVQRTHQGDGPLFTIKSSPQQQLQSQPTNVQCDGSQPDPVIMSARKSNPDDD